MTSVETGGAGDDDLPKHDFVTIKCDRVIKAPAGNRWIGVEGVH